MLRTTFSTSRLLDFFSEKELTAQVGHEVAEWPLVILKELIDNSLDACEEAGIPPVITVTVDKDGIEVADNGPGLPADTVKGIIDYEVRVSSREAYVSPTRGAQGNALKTLIAMPFVLDPDIGRVLEIEAKGVRHAIYCTVDRIRQAPAIERREELGKQKSGTAVRVRWSDLARSKLVSDDDDYDRGDDNDDDAEPDSPSSKPTEFQRRFLQIAPKRTTIITQSALA